MLCIYGTEKQLFRPEFGLRIFWPEVSFQNRRLVKTLLHFEIATADSHVRRTFFILRVAASNTGGGYRVGVITGQGRQHGKGSFFYFIDW